MNDPFSKMMRDHFIDRPSQPPHYQDVEQPSFDIFNDDLFHDLCGKRQGPAVQELLQLIDQADATQASFGLNAERFMKMAVESIKKLRTACLEDFKDL